MNFQLSTVIITIINFIILLFILKLVFWNKIKASIDERANAIEAKIKATDDRLKEAQDLKSENERILRMAKEEGKKITENKKKQADKIYEEILESAKLDATEMKKRAEGDINREVEKAKADIKNQVIELSLVVSQKALDKSLDEKEQRRLIDNFIDEVV